MLKLEVSEVKPLKKCKRLLGAVVQPVEKNLLICVRPLNIGVSQDQGTCKRAMGGNIGTYRGGKIGLYEDEQCQA